MPGTSHVQVARVFEPRAGGTDELVFPVARELAALLRREAVTSRAAKARPDGAGGTAIGTVIGDEGSDTRKPLAWRGRRGTFVGYTACPRAVACIVTLGGGRGVLVGGRGEGADDAGRAVAASRPGLNACASAWAWFAGRCAWRSAFACAA